MVACEQAGVVTATFLVQVAHVVSPTRGFEGTEAPVLSGAELGSLGAAGGERSGRANSLFREGLF